MSDKHIDEKKTWANATELADFYHANKLSCSESTIRAFNEFYELGLPEECLKIASGFTAGLGKSGCLCGGITGCVMALSLIAGRLAPDESNELILKVTNELHDRFKEINKATCCRVLTTGFEWEAPERRKQCRRYVMEASEITEDIINNQLNASLSK
ncbi:MAG: C-GCAxxG-C-C family protein [Clostridiales Family XIII bacterium]|jgi:C_GCAxxG_C_C family probable redox protein|nr:C-GCAxxG-C-C family protein [Clostridiales Family XIII bacterium]